MVDYSKWDKMTFDSDSDEEDKRRPEVTVMDSPSTVSFGGGKATIAINQSQPSVAATSSKGAGKGGRLDYSKWDAVGDDLEEDAPKEYFEDEWHREQVEEAKASSTSRTPLATSNATGAVPSKCKVSRFDKMKRNGGATAQFFWGQTAKECTIYVHIPAVCRSKQFTVRIQGPQLTVEQRGDKGTQIFAGKLAFGVNCARDKAGDAIEEDIDWEILDHPSPALAKENPRVIRVTMQKEDICKGARVVHWWPKVFEGQDPIDVQLIPDRKRRQTKGQEKTSFKETWAEAHKMFKEKVKKIVPQEIHC